MYNMDYILYIFEFISFHYKHDKILKSAITLKLNNEVNFVIKLDYHKYIEYYVCIK